MIAGGNPGSCCFCLFYSTMTGLRVAARIPEGHALLAHIASPRSICIFALSPYSFLLVARALVLPWP